MNKDIKDIEIFSEIDASRHDAVRSLFSEQTFERGTEIISYGKPVDGLYLLDEGEVAISIPGFEGTLATLKEGMSFGELSLFTIAAKRRRRSAGLVRLLMGAWRRCLLSLSVSFLGTA